MVYHLVHVIHSFLISLHCPLGSRLAFILYLADPLNIFIIIIAAAIYLSSYAHILNAKVSTAGYKKALWLPQSVNPNHKSGMDI